MDARDITLAHTALRVALGFNFLMHGLSRFITGVGAFAEGMSKSFASTVLPVPLAHAFALPLPFIEFTLGVLIILGFFTRPALIACSALLLALTFGVSLQAKWEVAGSQLMYQLIVAAVLCTSRYDAYSIDGRRRRAAGAVG